MTKRTAASSLVLALMLSMHTSATGPVAQAPGQADEGTLARLKQHIGRAECRDDTECRVLGIGANPCGGAEQFLAWSTRAANGDALQALAARYAEQRRKLHEQEGLASVCMLFPEPGVRCAKEANDPMTWRCVLVPAAGQSPQVR